MQKMLYNQTIEIRPDRLDVQLAKLHARQLHSFTARLVGLPTDVTGVFIRLFSAQGGGFFDVPVSLRPNGTTGICYLIGTCFPDVGEVRYEVHAFDARGNATALGAGSAAVEPFSSSGTPIEPGVPVVLDRIRDASGNWHTIKAVPDGAGGFTTIVDAE